MHTSLSIYHNCTEGETWASAFMLCRHAEDCGVRAEMFELSTVSEQRLQSGGYVVFILNQAGSIALQQRLAATNLWLGRLKYSILILGDVLASASAQALDECFRSLGAVAVVDSIAVDFFKARVIADWEDCVLQLATDLQAS
ncbi:hypothetical protein SH580_11945 [Coraliomargarita algicola]|uniref:Flavodoxin n=2 Tax=Coraliomargaritaceae TaxID=3056371 RepID=A0ABU1AI96_9BACT|nr:MULTISPECIES: hypothetical protein [unclassified Coraliomargarita]MDQ8194344.1 hypothetical protein [Coraliomargarita sp. SDUM461004]WPJ94144.1 hypothetical protein SH580_11945 [Coraliomargarita sp. J2-16]